MLVLMGLWDYFKNLILMEKINLFFKKRDNSTGEDHLVGVTLQFFYPASL